MSTKMKHVKLGNSGLKVSELCLGVMNFGWKLVNGTSEEESFNILNKFAEIGGNFIDAADIYANGDSERIVGKWLKTKKRENFVVATKVYWPTSSEPNDKGLSRKHILDAINGSLERLQVDYIDLYYCHSWDKDTPLEETLLTLNDLVRTGKVRYIAVSNFRGYQLMMADQICKKLKLEPFICLQPQYNLMTRELEHEVLPACKYMGLGVCPWSPLKQGWLTGKYNRSSTKPTTKEGRENFTENLHELSWDKNATEETWKIIDTLEELSKKLHKPIAQIALRWCMQRELITSTIIGPRTMKQAEDNFETLTWELSKEDMEQLNKVSAPRQNYPYIFDI